MSGLRVHHLDCATMCPLGGFHPAMVGHCLLVETSAGLVLVDTGFGSEDPRRLAWWLKALSGAVLAPARTAAAQVEALGFSRADVRHIVLTHLDLDHAGGLSDFPQATVHVQRAEHAAALSRQGAVARLRYLPTQWAHEVRWAFLDVAGDEWLGFGAVRDVPGLPPELLLVPLGGHTRGHQAVAVETRHGWLLHVGDLWPHRGRLAETRIPFGLAAMERAVTTDRAMLLRNQARVRDLHRAHPDVHIVCSHDPADLPAPRRVAGHLAPDGAG